MCILILVKRRVRRVRVEDAQEAVVAALLEQTQRRDEQLVRYRLAEEGMVQEVVVLRPSAFFLTARRMPTANAEELCRSAGTQRLVSSRPLRCHPRIRAGPRRSPSACPENSLKIYRRSDSRKAPSGQLLSMTEDSARSWLPSSSWIVKKISGGTVCERFSCRHILVRGLGSRIVRACSIECGF